MVPSSIRPYPQVHSAAVALGSSADKLGLTLKQLSGKVEGNPARAKLATHLNAMKAVVDSMQSGKGSMRRVANGKATSDLVAECGRYRGLASAWARVVCRLSSGEGCV